MILGSLEILFKGEEFTHLSDSDCISIIGETYKLDPEFFIASIYPKIASWDMPSFLNVKEELLELLRKEGANVS
ncbi:MAG: hypothetical protein HWN79_03130 [Candidatus Lokiarchaeota archaeon]|nr:hypothetical protein [Candidatus Lokiarchaeota archaeon]